MTEYDYSPAALEVWRKKQDRISKWASSTSLHKHPSPFSPTDRPHDNDFYSKPSTPSEIYGPDRPPSPPRSAPHAGGYGYGGGPYSGGGYFSGYQAAAGPSPQNVLVPRWNGRTWVYDASNASSPRRASPSPHHQPRPKSHRRRSVSGPPAAPAYAYPQPSAPMVSYNSNGVRVNVVTTPHATSPSPVVQHRPQYYRTSSWQQPQRSSSLPMAYTPAQPMANPYGYGVQPIVIVDAPRRKSSKLRKARV